MSDLDLVIRNGTVVTAEGKKRCDVGISAGKIAVLGEALPQGTRAIDAGGIELYNDTTSVQGNLLYQNLPEDVAARYVHTLP